MATTGGTDRGNNIGMRRRDIEYIISEIERSLDTRPTNHEQRIELLIDERLGVVQKKRHVFLGETAKQISNRGGRVVGTYKYLFQYRTGRSRAQSRAGDR